jgi:hypothetical protein
MISPRSLKSRQRDLPNPLIAYKEITQENDHGTVTTVKQIQQKCTQLQNKVRVATSNTISSKNQQDEKTSE